MWYIHANIMKLAHICMPTILPPSLAGEWAETDGNSLLAAADQRGRRPQACPGLCATQGSFTLCAASGKPSPALSGCSFPFLCKVRTTQWRFSEWSPIVRSPQGSVRRLRVHEAAFCGQLEGCGHIVSCSCAPWGSVPLSGFFQRGAGWWCLPP